MLVLVCLAQFMVVLDATIVNIALPSIQSDLDVLSTLAVDATSRASADAGASPSPAEGAAALVDGWQVAFTGGAVCLAAGLVVLILTLRSHHVAAIPTDESLAVGV